MPEGWEWTRFSAITINRDNERKPISSSQRTDVAKIYDYYGASGKIDKIDKYIFSERLLLIGEDGANLVTRSKPIAFFAEGQYWVNNHAHCIDATDKFILEYLCFYINAISLGKYVTGSAQPKMTQDNMNSILIPLPPYSEQKHMSQRLKEVMYTVDNIEIGKVDISDLVSKAKSKIIDLAIRGKLVPQDPNDEPASILLERIRAEKEELIKQGKIKRDKKKSVIFKGDDNSYYQQTGDLIESISTWELEELPDNWVLCCLGELCDYGNCNNVDADSIAGNAWILDLEDIEKNTGKVLRKIRKNERDFTSTKHSFYKGQVLYSKLRPYLNKVIIADEDGFCTSEILPLEFANVVLPQYALYYLMSPTFLRYAKQCSYGVKMPRLGTADGRKAIFPLPPIKEQYRIANSISKCFTQIDNILSALL
ncbi:restriction endonuclease subunit S [Coprococcus eutactus]|uniref:restriction endonuclease subunit S n=1 Tax=Coprococcus eutactus TaxID=33043 RepID=UPI001C00DF2A|nr:restriction endonuclease subunit S [Coprococcus eutactus]MCB6627783.1 restriction endonuclease subunit S [Coprococcus eutactus]MCG4790441.1 restriction endonuclease subunit S [Coprococcus eutactus]MCQ5117714.1 restriction endonuclease subunit S [Coprococcus eutactus]MCQ5132023.1 restriction endonuclease subunit S [Coprococcus eutactus]MCQ5136133.1 restriction endonuclease subunit S [Coprococcus eutactus]